MLKSPVKTRRKLAVKSNLGIIVVFILVFGGSLGFVYNDKVTAESSNDNYKSYESIKEDLKKYLSSCKGTFGIYFVDLKNNYEFGINEDEEYVAASTIKVPVNMFLYSKAASGEIKLEDMLEYMQNDYEEGTGSIQGEKIGTKFTLKEISKKSIVESDNVAINMIIRFVGNSNYKSYMRELGGTVVYDNKNNSSPKDMAKYLKVLYNSYSNGETTGIEIIDNMKNTVFNDRIPKFLPKDIEIAHKIGNQTGTRNDVGIVFAKNPFILCVMTKDIVNEEETDNNIADISKKVYDFMSNLNLKKEEVQEINELKCFYMSSSDLKVSIFRLLRNRFTF